MKNAIELQDHIINTEHKINELLGQHPDDVDWPAVNELTRKKHEMLKELQELKDNRSAVTYAEDTSDPVNHPEHYERDGAIECIDEMEMIFGREETMIFCKLNTWKYRYRAYDKNGAQDISKSDWYMRKYKELKAKGNQSPYTLSINPLNGNSIVPC